MIIETCPKCGADLQSITLTTYPPIPAKRCVKCNYYWQGQIEPLVRIPFNGYEEVYREYYDTANNYHWIGTHTGEHIIKESE